jgi:hypothetical protein
LYHYRYPGTRREVFINGTVFAEFRRLLEIFSFGIRALDKLHWELLSMCKVREFFLSEKWGMALLRGTAY